MLKKMLFSADFCYVIAVLALMATATLSVQMLVPSEAIGTKTWWITMTLVDGAILSLVIWHDREITHISRRFVRWLKVTTGNKHFGLRPEHTLATALAKKK